MLKMVIKYQEQLKVLNLIDNRTYTISNDKEADIIIDNLDEVIHLEQNDEGMWQANHTTIFKSLVRKRIMVT